MHGYVLLHEMEKKESNCKIEQHSWSNIFTICFKVINNKNLMWFQYRIIHEILRTEELLHKMSTMSIKCNWKHLLCDNSRETLNHLYYVQKLHYYGNWIHLRRNIKVTLTVPEILFGYVKSDYFISLNRIILVLFLKNCIFSASRKKS